MNPITAATLLATGTSASTAMGMAYLAAAQTIGMLMGNAVTTQQGTQRVAEASVAMITAYALIKGAAS